MLRIFKSNPILLLILPILLAVTIWVWCTLQSARAPFYIGTMPMFNTLFKWVSAFPVGALMLAFALLISEALLWNAFVNKNGLLKQPSYFSAFFYLLLGSCRPNLICIYPALVATLFLVLAMRRLADSYKKESALSELFDGGLFIGIAALIYVPVIVFILFLWAAVLIMRSLNWREWIVSLIGFFLPFGFALSYFAIFYTPEHFWYERLVLGLGSYKIAGLSLPGKGWLMLICVVIIAMSTLWFFINRISDNILKAQKISQLMVWFVFFGLISIVLSPEKNARSLTILVPPFSYIFSNYFLKSKHKIWPEMLFISFIAIVVFSIFF